MRIVRGATGLTGQAGPVDSGGFPQAGGLPGTSGFPLTMVSDVEHVDVLVVAAPGETQEAVLAIVRGLPRFDGRAAFSTWSYRVATNACLDELRRRGRRPVPTAPEPDDRGAATHPLDRSPALADAEADRLEVDAALATLPPEFRAAVVLRDLCQLDYAEIAETLGIPPGTVRSRIARGRAALAERLGDAAGNPAAAPGRPRNEP